VGHVKYIVALCGGATALTREGRVSARREGRVFIIIGVIISQMSTAIGTLI